MFPTQREKKPSLSVTPEKNLYHCFSTGCEGSGDIITFYRQFYNYNLIEALQKLNDDFNLGIEFSEDKSPEAVLREEANEQVREYHQTLLNDPKAEQARMYLSNRGVSLGTVRDYRLGYDCATRSIIFPVVHPGNGNTVWYFGPLDRSEDRPKYVGPRNGNPLKWPGLVFGLQIARRNLDPKSPLGKFVILVEGFFDVLTLHSKGIKNAVSLLGSSPRSDQIQNLVELKIPTAVIVFDPDHAGDAGMHALIEMAPKKIQLRIASLDIDDPDEFVLKHGPDALRNKCFTSPTALEFLIEETVKKLETEDYYEQYKTVIKAGAIIKRLGPLERELGIGLLSRRTGMDPLTLRSIFIDTDIKQKPIVNAERHVLAGLIKAPEKISDTSSDIWLVPSHERIYNIIREFHQIPTVTITPEFLKTKLPTENGILDQVLTASSDNFEYHLQLVQDAATRRKLSDISHKFVSELNSDSDLVAAVNYHLESISRSVVLKDDIEFSASAQVNSALGYIQERMNAGGILPGINLGNDWPMLMENLLGFQNGYMYLVAASAKAGKTATVQNWAMEIAVRQKIPTLWLNLEMSERDLALRNLSILSGISNARLRLGAILAPEKKRIDDIAATYHEAPFHVVNAMGMNVQEIINMTRKYIYSHGIKMVFLDYIQLILTDRRTVNYWEAHSFISQELKTAVSKHLNIPLVAISQLGRGAMTNTSTSAEFMAGAYKYIQDCDCYMGLRPPTKNELEEGVSGNAVLTVEANRHGPQGKICRLLFNGESLQVREIL